MRREAGVARRGILTFRKKSPSGRLHAKAVFGIMSKGSWPSLSITTSADHSNRLPSRFLFHRKIVPYGHRALELSLVETPSTGLPLMGWAPAVRS
jgi:hypothetical protein